MRKAISRVGKTKSGTLVRKTSSGVRLYYSQKLKRWVPSKYQGKGNKAGWKARGKNLGRKTRARFKKLKTGSTRGLRNL